MPTVVNLGLTKKHGLPDYGSIGASCSVSMELDGTLLQSDLESFHRRVRDAYVACAQAVNDELSRHRQLVDPEDPPVPESPAQRAEQANHGDSHAGNGNGSHRSAGASEKQQSYIQQLGRQIRGLGVRRLDELSDRMFGKPVGSLTSFEASSLIDQLKAIKSGQIDVAEVLGSGAAA